MRSKRSFFLTILAIAFTSGALTACAGDSAAEAEAGLHMAPLADMPAEVQAAPVSVQQAYRFAVANPEVLKEIPCYCGCGVMGHTSNYACYVAEVKADGEIVYDPHALGCSICVDITQDTMRLLKQGKSVAEIRAYVDGAYARYGPSNMAN